ncbi:hypothetical protein [Parasphingorhabdus sp.]|uniref:radical SAM protein n=1 Tax=Parasphingorhabdus sp. TaxID=2709688 RepID=UPI002B276BC0|nr:hypothetical protein [Parasphingorhabdus sp.]
MNEMSTLNRDNSLTDFFRRDINAQQLLNHKGISIISILMTYRCPAACAHCIFESNPQNKTHLDMDIARKVVEAASRQSPPPVLGFSGGEAFVRYKEMRELAAFGQSLGMPSEVISSSAWATSRSQAKEKLLDLRSVGFEAYCTSVDEFHIPFIKPEKMRWALQGARDAGLDARINVQVSSERSARAKSDIISRLSEILSIPESEVAEFEINPLITTPVGRARKEVTEFYYDDSKDMREGCPMATEIVTISPKGLLYPCCGMVVGEDPEKAGLFIQDNLQDKNVDEIAEMLDALKEDLFFKLLQYFGPYRILQELKRRDPSIEISDHYVGSCDVCLEFTSQEQIADATCELLADLGEVLNQRAGMELTA